MDSNSKPFGVVSVGTSYCLLVLQFVTFFSLLVAKKIDELQEILRKKDEDMKQMEERYKRYVEKARTVRTYWL